MWTVQILLRQKSVWEQFSKRYSLEFSRNALLKSPSLKGMFRDMYISVFSTEIEENNRSARKYRTVIQFDMKPGVPTEGIIASRAIAILLWDLGFRVTMFRRRRIGTAVF